MKSVLVHQYDEAESTPLNKEQAFSIADSLFGECGYERVVVGIELGGEFYVEVDLDPGVSARFENMKGFFDFFEENF